MSTEHVFVVLLSCRCATNDQVDVGRQANVQMYGVVNFQLLFAWLA